MPPSSSEEGLGRGCFANEVTRSVNDVTDVNDVALRQMRERGGVSPFVTAQPRHLPRQRKALAGGGALPYGVELGFWWGHKVR